MNKLTTADTYIAQLMMAGFFLPAQWQAVVVSGCSAYFCLRVFFMGNFVSGGDLARVLLLGSIFLLYAAALVFTAAADRAILFNLISNRISLLLYPFMFAVFMPYFGGVVREAIKTFVYVCVAVCTIANAAFIAHICHDGNALGPQGHVAYRQYLEHFSGLHPTYLSMYIVLAVAIVLTGGVKVSKALQVVILSALLVFLVAILAKAPLTALCLIVLHAAYVHRDDLKRYRLQISVVALVIVAAFLCIPFARQRAGELFSFTANKQALPMANNSMYERTMIWHTDMEVLHDYWLAGAGPARLMRYLDHRYLFDTIYKGAPTGYFDPHNAYLWEWLSFGIVGIIVLFVVLTTHIITALKRKDHPYLYLMCVLCITFATESVLSRQQGILFYAAFTSLFFFYKPFSIHLLKR